MCKFSRGILVQKLLLASFFSKFSQELVNSDFAPHWPISVVSKHKKHWWILFCTTKIPAIRVLSCPTQFCFKHKDCFWPKPIDHEWEKHMIVIQPTWSKGFGNLCIQRISSERYFKLGPLYHLTADYLSIVFIMMLTMKIWVLVVIIRKLMRWM